ncbi:MAG: radical SAM protein [Bryobacterales bacterium]|nr:radical SAM protein [Bryobacterales bacterium]
MKLPTEYNALVGALLDKAATVGQPASGVFEITSRCNLACGMCYIRHSASDLAAMRTELSAMQWNRLAREAAVNGMLFLLLTGGEVFLRPDFLDIYEQVRTLGLNLTLFTNATLVTKEIADRLSVSPPNLLEVTLYGATEATYEAITGVPGSYARCLSGIENLRLAGVPLLLKTTLTRLNIGELEAMRRLAREWNVPFQAAWLLTPRRDGKDSAVREYRLSPRQCVELEGAQASREPAPPNRTTSPSTRSVFFCGAGKNSFVITASGEMNACIDLPRPAARPLECGFARAWDQVGRFVDSVPASAVCSSCELDPVCPRCPALSLIETGDLMAPVPYLCEIATARYGPRITPSQCT